MLKMHKLQKKVESHTMIASGNFDWKHKGNRLQYDYNLSVVNKLTEASTAADHQETTGDLTKQCLAIIARAHT
jgi:hypothetical protein